MTFALDRICAALAIIDARYETRSDLAPAPLPDADAAEIIDVLMAEFQAEQTFPPLTFRNTTGQTRVKLDCLGLTGTATRGSASALLAWTINARCTLATAAEDAA